MGPEHRYTLSIDWTGNRGSGTSGYRVYGRDHLIAADGPPVIAGSSDRTFRGDAARWNPEQLLVASVAQCHLLTYLHLAVNAGVVVTGYRDTPVGTMVEDGNNGGQFRDIVLRPAVTVAEASMVESAVALHGEVGKFCFIARSVNFPIHHEPEVTVG